MAGLLSLVALGCASYSSCASVEFPALLPRDAYYDDSQTSQKPNNRGVRPHRTNAAARSTMLVLEGAIMIGILFLLVRCAAYISKVPQLSKETGRRLMEGSPCGDDVSHRHG